ncbi:CAP domain-containing protein [Thalassovita mangrovi]|nr:CAP domain-containing protein [Thalassovita mangrovi]
MTTPTAVEQEILELINRARLDPVGEFDRLISDAASGTGVTDEITNALDYFGVDLDMFLRQLQGIDPLAPVAWNSDLASAATGHTDLMIAQDAQAHVLTGEAEIWDRVVAAGYDNARTVGENIYAYSYDPIYAHAGFYIDWGNGPGGMQDPAGHRNTILSSAFTEVGIDAQTETDSSTQVGPLVVTQDFGNRSDYVPVLRGVVIRDQDGDRFYDAGEGLSGVTISATSTGGETTTTTSWDSGGYQLALDPGTYTVTFSGGTIVGTATYQVAMGTQNTQLYGYYADATTATPIERTGGNGNDTLTGDSGNDQLDGAGGNDSLTGGNGSDTLIGNDGDDFLFGGGDSSDLRDDIYGGTGHDSIDGGYGNDMLRGDAGNDTIIGGFGADTVIGGDDDDVLTGQAWGDVLFGGNGDDFINGGFGYDRANGGSGADQFYHLGVAGHGSDWIQDYNAAEGDVLVYGGSATLDQFQVNFTETANAGVAGVEEAFVIYRPTGQILWALVDGGGQSSINIMLDDTVHDLLA